MLGKKSRPAIRNLAGPSHRSGLIDTATSPRSPLDFKIQSPRGLKYYDLGGVGLGIVAALEKSGDPGCKIPANKAVFVQNPTRSNPIPVNPAKTNSCGRYNTRGGFEQMECDEYDLEDYTFVTCHGPNKYSHTRVYCDGAEYGKSVHDEGIGFDISPAIFGEDFTAATAVYPASDFLSSCHLCQKKLFGEDIYMYRGEKAFCSTECRYRQIVMDERKEQCSSEASRSAAEVSNSPYTNGQIFSTGILAI
ncbi:hypothetical protein U1Q18_028818 [Sarracenia purpurea var. burkii]